METDQLHDDTIESSGSFAKASILHELGRFMLRAYDQGVTLEEAHAICGAAYGDWREAYDVRTQGMLGEEGAHVHP